MDESGMGRFAGNLDPRAQEFRPRYPNIPTTMLYPLCPHPYLTAEVQVLPYCDLPVCHPVTYTACVQAAPPSAAPTRSLLLSSVPFDVSETEVRRELERFGDVRGVQMERVGEGIVTVHFYDLRHALRALNEIREQHMQQQSRLRNHYGACPSTAAPRPPPARGLIAGCVVWAQFVVPASHVGRNQGTIVVFNLHPDVTSNFLRQTFQAFGPVKELRETPSKKQQRFVEFFDVRDAARALAAMDGKEIHGRCVVIEFSRPGGHNRRYSRPPPPPRSTSSNSSSSPSPSSQRSVKKMEEKSAPRKKGIVSGKVRPWKGKKKLDNRFLIAHDSSSSPAESDPRTTVMIKNIPNKYSQKLVLNMLDNHCIHCNEQIAHGEPLSSYDFVYLPIDFNNKCNVGYGFVNMTSPEATLRLYKAFHQQSWEVFNSRKICEVTYARVQGLEALKEHFKNSKFPCEVEHYLPVVFSPPRDGKNMTEPVAVAGQPLDIAGLHISDGGGSSSHVELASVS